MLVKKHTTNFLYSELASEQYGVKANLNKSIYLSALLDKHIAMKSSISIKNNAIKNNILNLNGITVSKDVNFF